MQFFLLLFLIALTGTLWGRSRFLKIYGQESLNHLSSGVTGAEFAEAILKRAGLGGIAIAKGRGVLPDFYDPEQRRISLAPQHFGATTYSALALAALQVGKALQHAAGHRPLLWRVAAVRASVFLSPCLLFLGIVTLALGMTKTVFPLVVLTWSLIAFWNLITVPTEVDAGIRAKRVLDEMNVFRNLDERIGIEKVIGAASTAHIDGLSLVGSWLTRTFLPNAPGKTP
jgi:Zn-dependent membrane protease YugP